MQPDFFRPSDAEIDLLREVQWSERDPEGRAFAALADAYRKRGELQLARTLAQEGADRLPTFVSGHVVLGLLHRALGSPVEADQAFRRVLDMDPENTVALKSLGELAQERQSHAEAAEYFRKLQLLDPNAVLGVPEDGGVDEVGAASPEAGSVPVDVATLSPGANTPEDPTTVDLPLLTPDGDWGSGLEPVGIGELSPDTDPEITGGRAEGVSILDLGPSDPPAGQAADPDASLATDPVPVNELAPEEGSFEFSVADLDDLFKVEGAPEGRGAVVEPAESDALIDAEPDESPAVTAPEWSWSPVSEEEEVQGSQGGAGTEGLPVAELAPESAPTPVAELSPEPELAESGGIPVGELAPDLDAGSADRPTPGEGRGPDRDLEQPIEVHGALDDFPVEEDDPEGWSDSAPA
ncbi:MAG: hypothetical protein OEO23_13365, partial [Gemmatimonadota bacterium]|nr:hypothetical protein [Gemmatimonadota bacterium]